MASNSTSNWVDDFCESPRWDEEEFSDLSLTGATPCFESCVLRGTAHISFLLLLTYRMYKLKSVPILPHGIKTETNSSLYAKLVLSIVNVVVAVLLLNGLVASDNEADFELVTEPVAAIVWIYATFVLWFESHRFLRRGRWILPFLWLFSLAADVVRFPSQWVLSQESDRTYFFVLFAAGVASQALLVLSGYFIRPSDLDLARRIAADWQDADSPADSLGKDNNTYLARVIAAGRDLRAETNALAPPDPSVTSQLHPEARANFLSRTLFSWMTPLMRLGMKRPLMADDVSPLRPEYRASAISDTFERVWREERSREKPSLLRAFRRAFGLKFALAGIPLLIQSLAQYVPPLLLRRLIEYVDDDDDDREWFGYYLGCLMFVAMMVMTLCENRYFDLVTKTGLRVRSAMVGCIYRKALRMSNKARQERSVGSITNHMATDTEKLQLQCMMLHNLWSSPLRIIIAMYLLFDGIGVSIIVGLILVIAMTPVQIKVMGLVAKFTKSLFRDADGRIKIVNEILSGIRVLKYYCWEPSFLTKITEVRTRELRWLKKIAYTRGLVLLLINLNPVVLAVGTFGAFAIIDGDLTPEKAFFALSVFNLLYFPVLLLPRTVSMVLETLVSLRRVEGFLLCEELKEDRVHKSAEEGHAPEFPIVIERGWFTWDKAPTLRDINISVKQGELVAVIGSTGCGKSSLISAMLSEMTKTQGTVKLEGSVAYATQQAWIYNATVRENILFGLPFDSDRYWETVRVCCLQSDFGQFAAGDSTEIGEKGINLSGGQKQRLSLARAVYSRSDIILLDDPLSALDAHVGAEVFEECFRKALAGKTRVLVTNQLQFIPRVDKVLVMDSGKIVESGSPHELMEVKDSFFAKMMAEQGGLDEAEGDEETKADDVVLVDKPGAGAGAGAGAGWRSAPAVPNSSGIFSNGRGSFMGAWAGVSDPQTQPAPRQGGGGSPASNSHQTCRAPSTCDTSTPSSGSGTGSPRSGSSGSGAGSASGSASGSVAGSRYEASQAGSPTSSRMALGGPTHGSFPHSGTSAAAAGPSAVMWGQPPLAPHHTHFPPPASSTGQGGMPNMGQLHVSGHLPSSTLGLQGPSALGHDLEDPFMPGTPSSMAFVNTMSPGPVLDTGDLGPSEDLGSFLDTLLAES